MGGDLTFLDLSIANADRAREWHSNDTETWSGADWSNQLAGEVGEAANLVKKLRMIETGVPREGLPEKLHLLDALGAELADVIICADILASYYGLSLAEWVKWKFNLVSQREGFDIWL